MKQKEIEPIQGMLRTHCKLPHSRAMACSTLRMLLLAIALWLAIGQAQAQKPDLYPVFIKARVESADGGDPIPYAHVINSRIRGGTTSNADGQFSINMLTEDTLVIRAIGFVDYSFTVEEFPPKDLYIIKMQPVRYLLDEVTVTESLNLKQSLGLPQAKPLDIPIELRGNSFNEKPPIWAAFFNPLAFANYHLSSREKGKREVLNVIRDEKQWREFARFFNLEAIERITGLTGIEADKFMMYCNMNNQLPYFASQLEVEFQIRDFYYKYLKEQEALKTQPSE